MSVSEGFLELRPGSCCWFHDDERPMPTDLIQCLECGHCYRDSKELREAYKEMLVESGLEASYPVPPVSRIYSCPLCAHDW